MLSALLGIPAPAQADDAKLDPGLRARLATGDTTTFWVELHDSAGPAAAPGADAYRARNIDRIGAARLVRPGRRPRRRGGGQHRRRLAVRPPRPGRAWVSSNGALSFGGPETGYTNRAIPDGTVPNAALYLSWDDPTAWGGHVLVVGDEPALGGRPEPPVDGDGSPCGNPLWAGRSRRIAWLRVGPRS